MRCIPNQDIKSVPSLLYIYECVYRFYALCNKKYISLELQNTDKLPDDGTLVPKFVGFGL